ncbi:hypothetical protein [Parasitella parasitica]|uniref:AMP-dependent synthetase/ligase domain-containing protein n=1 Tax=Parasitella parasitica TaxID=35722 RepID=A0A0B7NCH5_9FUNG|nr:hypothetical protein [Parasitella parasitica]
MVIHSPLPDIKIPETGIIQFLFDNNPHYIPQNRKVLIDAFTGESLTYGKLKDNILRFAATLQDKFDFKHGDVVAIYSPNQIDYSVLLLGTIAAGGSATPANPAYTPKELAYQMEMTGAKILIAHPSNVELALIAADMVSLPKERIFVFGGSAINGVLPYSQVFFNERRASPIELTAEETKDSVAYLCFSSGTTGKLSIYVFGETGRYNHSNPLDAIHSNMTSNVMQFHTLDHAFINADKDTALGVLPFYHMFALSVLLHSMLYMGIPLYVMPQFDLVRFCKTVQEQKITFSALVPPIILLLAKNPVVDQYDITSLKLAICGAAPLGKELSHQVRKRIPTMIVKQGYGLTETSPCAIIEPTDRVIDAGSVGVLMSSMTAKIVDEEGKEVATGERGELWLKGPNIMKFSHSYIDLKGYINNPEQTAGCIDEDGYFHSGDVAVQDENGHFFIVDRIKELIKYKGFQVPPAELEAILVNSPIVADCAVIGVYDADQATELPRGYITLNPDIPESEDTANTIKKFVSDQVVHYKQLRSIRFIKEVPKSPAGKILRKVLREMAAEEEKQLRLKNKL